MSVFRRGSAAPGERRALTFQSIWGSGRDALKLNGSQDQALRLVPVFAAARLLADGVSSLPLDQYEVRNGVRRPVPLAPAFARTNDPSTTQTWVAKAITSMVLRGNAFGLPSGRAEGGAPARIDWLSPDDVDIYDDEAINPLWLVGGQPVDGPFVHVPNFVVPGRHLGLSPIGAYRTTIETGLYAQDFGRDWFRNGATPSGVVSVDAEINGDQAAEVKGKFKGAAKSREPVVMGRGWDYKPISVAADESQFLATIKATATQVAAIYGIPPEMLGGESGSSMTYANVEQQQINFLTLSLRPYLTRLEAALSSLLPGEDFVRFNVDAMIRTDLKSRYEAHEIALRNKWLDVNDVREIEDKPPLADSAGRAKNFQDVGLPALVDAGIVSAKWAAEQVGAPSEGLSDKPQRVDKTPAKEETP